MTAAPTPDPAGTGRRAPVAALVVGLGNADRGDDGVGLAVAARVRAQASDRVRVLEDVAPTSLLDLWEDVEVAVVVDAVRSGATPGSVHVMEAGVDPLPRVTGSAGTHAFGLAEAVELARRLDRLPPRLLVVGVEAAGFALGTPLSPEVRDAVGPAVDAVLAAVAGQRTV